MPNFDLFFYYKNRFKIRNSFFLESLSPKLKTLILFHYREDNFKLIDNLIRFFKFLLFSVIYLVLIISIDFNYESLHIIGYVVFSFIGFFIALMMLSYNRESLKDVEHDHYFRMLSENRNELLKQIALRRINYGFLNWLIPVSFPLFLYAAIFTSFHFIVQYIVLITLYYLFLFIMIFATQKLLFKFLKKTIIIGDILIYIFSILIVGCPIILHFLMLMISFLFESDFSVMLVYLTLSIFLIFILWYLKILIYKTTYNYSVTHTLLLGNNKNYNGNKLKNPPFFIKLFLSKDNFSNLILTKDLLSFYRKDKRETFSLLFLIVMSFMYSFFVITSLTNEEAIQSVIPVDNTFLTVIMILFVIANYRYKEINWLSSEGKNLELFKKLEYEPLSLYKSKLKLNSIILLPMILIYVVSPLFFIFSYNYAGMMYAFIRVVFIFTYALIILEYPLISDARKTLIKKYKNKLFMRVSDLVMFIFFIQGVGLSFFLTFVFEKLSILEYSYLYWIFIVVMFLVMVISKIRFLYIRRSFRREEAYKW